MMKSNAFNIFLDAMFLQCLFKLLKKTDLMNKYPLPKHDMNMLEKCSWIDEEEDNEMLVKSGKLRQVPKCHSVLAMLFQKQSTEEKESILTNSQNWRKKVFRSNGLTQNPKNNGLT